MKFNVHAGHTPQDGHAPGASGIVHESVENRKIKDIVIKILRSRGHTVYDCTAEGKDVSDNLYRIVNKCNAHKVDLDISIHLNCYNGKAHGTETLVYSVGNKATKYASKINKKFEALGFENRKVKGRKDLYVLRRTNAPALLVETFFCDSKTDCDVYKKVGAYGIAKAIADGVAPVSKISKIKTKIASKVKKPAKKPTTTKYKVIAKAGLNIRKKPVDGSIITAISYGATITTTKESSGWVYSPHYNGWLCKKYLKKA